MLSDIASSCRVDIQRQAMRAVIACTEISVKAAGSQESAPADNIHGRT